MGKFVSGVLGLRSDYEPSGNQAGNPYSADQFMQQQNNQQQIYQQQQSLAAQLQQQALGLGPNPAQTQFQQNSQRNIANAQGLIASQRGVNPGLAAKMGSNVAANANETAASQSSLLQQLQQVQAQQNLGNLYGQMQQGNLGQQSLYNEANLGAGKLNQLTAQGNQQAALGITGAILGGGGSALTASGGKGGGAATPPPEAAAAHGGMIGYANGGQINPGSQINYTSMTQPSSSSGGPASVVGKYFQDMTAGSPGAQALIQGGADFGRGVGSLLGGTASPQGDLAGGPMDAGNPQPVGFTAANGGQVPQYQGTDYFSQPPLQDPALEQRRQQILQELERARLRQGDERNRMLDEKMGIKSQDQMMMAAQGGMAPMNYMPGGAVPGQASVPGDSLKNDTVQAVVSPGEIVLPRSVTMANDAPNKAAAFVAAVLARKRHKE